MAVISPLPEPKKEGFLSVLRDAASGLFANAKRVISTPFGQETISPVPKPPDVRVVFTTPTPRETITPVPTAMPIMQPTPTLRPDIPSHDFLPILQKFFPKNEWNNAQNIAMGESSFNPLAINKNKNGSRDYGLFQINDIHAPTIKKQFGYDMEDLFDPIKNIEVASWLFARSGWKPWIAAKKLGLVR